MHQPAHGQAASWPGPILVIALLWVVGVPVVLVLLAIAAVKVGSVYLEAKATGDFVAKQVGNVVTKSNHEQALRARTVEHLELESRFSSPTLTCMFLGGWSQDPVPGLEQGAYYLLEFAERALYVHTTSDDANVVRSVPRVQITEFTVDGRGHYSTGGGFIGGGFGAKNALTGISVSAYLNKLTTWNRVESILHFVTADVSLYFTNELLTPDEVRVGLAHYFMPTTD